MPEKGLTTIKILPNEVSRDQLVEKFKESIIKMKKKFKIYQLMKKIKQSLQ